MIHRILLDLNDNLPFSPPLTVGIGAALIIVLVLWLGGRSRGPILACLAIALLAAGLVIGLSGLAQPAEPLTWGQVEELAEAFVGPAAYRRREQITTAAFGLALILLYIVYNLAFQEKPGEGSRRMLRQDREQAQALGNAHLCRAPAFQRWTKHDPLGWTLQGRFWGAKGRLLGKRLCLSGEDIARGVAVFGAQGSGKTQSVILPAIADRMRDGHSLIVTDVQGELQPYISAIAAVTRHVIVVHNPSDPEGSCAINLCRWIDNVADAQAIASALLSEASNQGDNQFWTKSAANLLAACALLYPSFGAALDARQDLQRMAQHLKNSDRPGVADLSNDFVNSIHSRDPKLGLNIMATAFNTGLAPWADPAIRQISSGDDLDLIEQMTTVPTVVILRCARRHTDAYGPYLGKVLRVLTMRLDDAGEVAGGPLPIPVGLVLEEFPALGRLDSLVRDINLMRKRRISVLTAAQSLAQFDHLYPGRGEAERLMAGLATKIVFGGCDRRTADYFCEISGQQTLTISSASRSQSRSGSMTRGTSSSSASLRGRALLLADDIIRPARGHATIFAAYTSAVPGTGSGGERAEQAIFHARLTPFFQRKDWELDKVRPRAPLVMPRLTPRPPARPQRRAVPNLADDVANEIAISRGRG